MTYRSLLITSSLLLLLAAPVAAQEAPGLWVPEADAKRLVEDLRDLKTLRAEVETLKAQLAAKEQELGLVRDSDMKREIALAIAEDRDKRREEAEQRLLRALEISDKQLQRSNEVLDKALKRIDSLETRSMWMMILGPIGLLLGLAAGAAF